MEESDPVKLEEGSDDGAHVFPISSATIFY